MDDLPRMSELKNQGYYCSQILLMLDLEMRGKSNPDLVRAMQGLAGGIGFTGLTCGVLTGAACWLGLYAGKGTSTDEDDPRLIFMTEDLVRWFQQTWGERFGGIDCDDILANGVGRMANRCAEITLETRQKVKEILVENGFDLWMDRDG